MIKHLDEVVQKAKARGKRRLVVAYGQDSHTLEAVSAAIDAGIIDATVVGDSAVIEKVCKESGIDAKKFTVVHETVDTKCVQIAVKLVAEGQGDVLMKGLVSTDKYMRGILSKDFGLVPPKGVLSHVAVLEIPKYHKLLVIGDVAVIPYPEFSQKVAIAKFVIQTAQTLEIDTPKVACLAPSEQLLPSVQSSIEAAMLAKMIERGQLGMKAVAEGPFALDVAVDMESAQTKKLTSSPVAGDADCLVFPNIDAGNVFFKTCTKFGGAELAGMVVGAKVPCVLTSRGDSSKTKMYSIALACLSAK